MAKTRGSSIVLEAERFVDRYSGNKNLFRRRVPIDQFISSVFVSYRKRIDFAVDPNRFSFIVRNNCDDRRARESLLPGDRGNLTSGHFDCEYQVWLKLLDHPKAVPAANFERPSRRGALVHLLVPRRI